MSIRWDGLHRCFHWTLSRAYGVFLRLHVFSVLSVTLDLLRQEALEKYGITCFNISNADFSITRTEEARYSGEVSRGCSTFLNSSTCWSADSSNMIDGSDGLCSGDVKGRHCCSEPRQKFDSIYKVHPLHFLLTCMSRKHH